MSRFAVRAVFNVASRLCLLLCDDLAVPSRLQPRRANGAHHADGHTDYNQPIC